MKSTLNQNLLAQLDPHIDWDLNVIYAITLAEHIDFRLEVALLTSHPKFNPKLTTASTGHWIDVVIRFPHAVAFRAKDMDLDVNFDENGKKDYGELFKITAQATGYSVAISCNEILISSDEPVLLLLDDPENACGIVIYTDNR